jgi:threonylcarbamoyladenosine tRNA methylthiotransferase MtaB
MPGQVDSQTKHRRLIALKDLALHMRTAVLREQIGKSVEILCEGNPDGERRETRFGYSPNYLPVQVAAHETTIDGNQLVKVVLSGLDDGGLALVGRPTDRRPDSRD